MRDILRQSQLLRKESGLEVQDRIYLSLVTESADLRRVIETYRSFIESETLGALSLEPLAKPLGSVEVPLQSAQREGGAVRVSLAKRDA